MMTAERLRRLKSTGKAPATAQQRTTKEHANRSEKRNLEVTQTRAALFVRPRDSYRQIAREYAVPTTSAPIDSRSTYSECASEQRIETSFGLATCHRNDSKLKNDNVNNIAFIVPDENANRQRSSATNHKCCKKQFHSCVLVVCEYADGI